jgi:general secretion pathway protein E
MLLGELLQRRGLIKAEDLARALGYQAGHQDRLGTILVRMGAVSEAALYEVLSEQLGLRLVGAEVPTLGAIEEAWPLLEAQGLAKDWLLSRGVVPWVEPGGALAVACADPLDTELREALELPGLAGEDRWCLMSPGDLERCVARAREAFSGEQVLDAQSLREMAEDAPVIAFVNNVLAQAVELRASDIHIEPGESEFAVRFRIDGALVGRMAAPMARFPAVASRLKLISHLDIAERRLPQDGRISVRVAGQDVDIRTSSIPAAHGESIVMRLLPKRRDDLGLVRLGMEPDHLSMLRDWLNLSNGLVLVTGPTGSGKSTTLYSSLGEINDATRKIITVEDPVEFRLPNVVQIQTQAEIGFTFARALRSILRHDPDVIMIGEIRDRETAEIAIQSALTGHLVLATLHTNDAPSAVTRLIDMGIEPYMVGAALRATMAQRLVRRLCTQCARDGEARGCAACGQTGYRGRIGIYELVTVDAELQRAIVEHGGLPSWPVLERRGLRHMRDDGLTKVGRGLTTRSEVLRVTDAVAPVE